MAKYDVLFSCGHKGLIEIDGDVAAVEKRIKYLTEKGTCTDCFKKSRASKKKELVLDAVLTGDKKGVVLTFSGSAYVVKDKIKALGFKFDGSKWSKTVSLSSLDSTTAEVKEGLPEVVINTDKLIYQRPKCSLYAITATEAIDTLVGNVMLNHPYISKTQAKKLVLNALIGSCVIEEVNSQVNFLIENGGYAE